MITIQILNKILHSKNINFIDENNLTQEHFVGYEDEFNFIIEHHRKYGNVPDKTTFQSKFNNFVLSDVKESDEYLLETLYEEHLYHKSVGIIQEVANLLKQDARIAVEYLQSQIQNLQIQGVKNGVDIIKDANQRYEIYQEKMNSENSWYISTGFIELDYILNGWSKGEELVVLFARTGEGKSWVLAKTLTHAWKLGNRVGYISPEMSADKIGFRFDTLYKNFSNMNLVWGRKEQGYANYIEDLKKKENPFIVATPLDFQKKITITKLKQFIQSNKLDILGIDGITYLTDERHKRGDTKTITLTNISEDLMGLSLELQIPILVVVQSNRGGVIDKDSNGTPALENIRDSDGIAQNATKVIALRQLGGQLEFGIKKHRDGASGGKLVYDWDIDKGEFSYVAGEDDNLSFSYNKSKTNNYFDDEKDIF